MKTLSIKYPTDLSTCNVLNDNIDVFVRLENGRDYCVTVATIEWVKNDMKDGFQPAGAPMIIVSKLEEKIIEKAIADYCNDDAYWLRLFTVSYGDSIPE